MGNPYSPDPYSQPNQSSSYDPYRQPETYQQYNQPMPGGSGYNPYQQPQGGYQQYSQPGSGAYGPPASQPNIIVNVQQGQQQYQMQPMMVAVAQQTNGKATAAMILGLLAFIAWFLTGIPAVILGHMALSEINASGGMQGGRGQAITGLVLGYLSVVGLVCFCLYFFLVLGRLSST